MRWLNLSYHHPKLLELAAEAFKFVQDVRHKPTAGKLLVLYGGSGNGKTRTLRAILTWFWKVSPNMKPVRIENHLQQPGGIWKNWPEIVDGFKIGGWGVVEDLKNEYLVGLDDIGAEHDPSKIGVEKLYQILNVRERRYTIVTTNIIPEQWEEKFERRVASRLLRNSVLVDLSEVPDYNAR